MDMKTADVLEHWLTLVAFVISQYQAHALQVPKWNSVY
jgi:hypothetical protein